MGSETLWYVHDGGSEAIGPVTTELLIQGVRSGRVPASARICAVGGSEWVALATHPDFASLMRELAPPPQYTQQASATELGPPDVVGPLGMHKRRMLVLVAAMVGALACFLPWVNAPIVGGISGTQGPDGWIVFAIFASAAGLCVLGKRAMPMTRGPAFGAMALGVFGAGIGVWKVVAFHNSMSDVGADNPFAKALTSTVSVGIGLYLVVVAGVVIALIAISAPRRVQFLESGLRAQPHGGPSQKGSKAFAVAGIVVGVFVLACLALAAVRYAFQLTEAQRATARTAPASPLQGPATLNPDKEPDDEQEARAVHISVATFQTGDVLDRCSDFTVTPPHDAPPGWSWSPVDPGGGETFVPLQKACARQFQDRPVLATCAIPELQYPDGGADVRPLDRGITLSVIRQYYSLSTLAAGDGYMRACLDANGDWHAVAPDSEAYRAAARRDARQRAEQVLKGLQGPH